MGPRALHVRSADEPRLLVGLMCGTSGDGISAAAVELRGLGFDKRIRLLAHLVWPYPPAVRELLTSVLPPARFDAAGFAEAHTAIGGSLADAVDAVARAVPARTSELAAVAIQAPTLFHRAPTDVGTGAHVELGEPAIVAERTGTLVVSDLRPADVAAGGHGAPLSVYVDYLLFRDTGVSRAVQNIGGIANVTYMRAGARPEDLLSFDTGPGNLLIDEAMRRLTGGNEQFDPSGSWAARGKVCQPLLAELMRHPYLERRPPKTTGREDFGSRLVDEAVGRATELGCSPEDLVATLTAFTVECIRLHFVRDLAPRGPLDEVILSGGGTHNDELMRRLREALQPARLRLHDEFGIPGDAREAVTWAVLADESLFGRPANIPDASGARHPVILGRVSFGRPPRLD